MSLGNRSIATVQFPWQPWSDPNITQFKALKFIFMWIKRKNINQWACYNRIWSWTPVPCEKHDPWASVMTKTSAFDLGFGLLSLSGHVFHTAWETMIKSCSQTQHPMIKTYYSMPLHCNRAITVFKLLAIVEWKNRYQLQTLLLGKTGCC